MISKLDNGKWEARGWEAGTQYRRRFTTKKAAEQYELEVAKREETRRNGLPVQRERLTYHELSERYLAQHQTRSRDWFENMLGYSLERFGTTELSQLLPDRIAVWLTSLPHSPKTKGHIYDSMKQVLEMAVEWGYLQRNPITKRSVRRPAQTDPDIRPFQSWDEVHHLAHHATGTNDPLIRFFCSTGMRPEEWIALTWADINIPNRTASINKVVVDGQLRTDRGKTDAAFRTIHLQQIALDALHDLARPIDSTALVFPNGQGGYINLDNWRQRIWHPTLRAASLDPRPLYQCRHTYATLALSAGADLYWISKQLGHTNITTTLKHYARFQTTVDQRNLDLLDSYARHAYQTSPRERRHSGDIH